MKVLFLIFFSSLFIRILSVNCFAESRGLQQQVIVRFDCYTDVCFDPVEQITAILSYSCELPYVLIDSNHTATEKINAVLTDYNEKYREASEGVSTDMDMETYMLAQAEDYYSMARSSSQNGDVGNCLFTFSHKACLTRCDDAIIVFTFFDNTGSPAGMDTKTRTLAFNAQTGALLDLDAVDISNTADYPKPEKNAEGIWRIDTAAQFAEDPLSETERVIDLLEIDPQGEEYYLRVSGELYDVRFTTVVYYDRCYEKEQLWYCNRMNNEALQLKLTLPEDTPTLKLTFASPSCRAEESAFVFARDAGSGAPSFWNPNFDGRIQ